MTGQSISHCRIVEELGTVGWDKLARLQQIVLDSNKQKKPTLSAEQWEKLQAFAKAK